MRCQTVIELPPPPPGKAGWPFDRAQDRPWTEESPQGERNPVSGNPWPRVSIVTPSYNQGQFIEETIRSVLLQGYPNLEYIIIDGGSTDGSVDIVRKYEPWLAYWVSEPDRGQAHAINKGFAQANGEIMAWLNSDDLLCPHAVRRVVNAFLKNANLDVICGFRKVINRDGNVTSYLAYPPSIDDVLKRWCIVAQETVFWRRRVWEHIGPLDEGFAYAFDYEYWQRMLANGYEFVLLPYFLGCFRHHEASKGATMNHVRNSELKEVYQRYFDTDHLPPRLEEGVSIGWWIHFRVLNWFARVGLLDIHLSPRH